MLPARAHVGNPSGEAVGAGEDLDVAAVVMMFSAAPQLGAVSVNPRTSSSGVCTATIGGTFGPESRFACSVMPPD
jgi:hypothetical protein